MFHSQRYISFVRETLLSLSRPSVDTPSLTFCKHQDRELIAIPGRRGSGLSSSDSETPKTTEPACKAVWEGFTKRKDFSRDTEPRSLFRHGHRGTLHTHLDLGTGSGDHVSSCGYAWERARQRISQDRDYPSPERSGSAQRTLLISQTFHTPLRPSICEVIGTQIMAGKLVHD